MSQSKNKSLLKAVKFGRGGRVNRLVNGGHADVNSVDESGKCAIFTAVENGYIEVAKILLENGADVDSKYNGYTCLLMAIKTDQKKMVKLLLSHGANLQLKGGPQDLAPFDFAMNWKRYEITKTLFEASLAKGINIRDCIICYSSRTDVFVLNPCGHAKLCEACTLKLFNFTTPKCPLCREDVTNYLRVFY